MQFQQKELKTVVAKAKAFVARRGALPILKGIRISARKGTVTFEATDLEGFVIVMAKTDDLANGEMVVAADALAKAVAAAKGAKVTLDFDGTFHDGNGVTTSLPVMEADDWPGFPTPDETLVPITGELVELAEAVPRIALASSHDQARPILCGIAVEVNDHGGLDLTCTDSYRLATFRSEATPRDGKLPEIRYGSVIWPAAVATKAVKQLTGRGIAIHIGERGSWIASDQMVVYMRHIEGAFPKWRSLWPDESALTWTWTFDGGPEIEKLVTVAKMYDGVPVVLDFDLGTEVATKADHGSFEGKMTGTWTTFDDDSLKLALHPTYLADSIRVVGTKGTRLQAIDAMKPVIVTSADERYRALQMPVRI